MDELIETTISRRAISTNSFEISERNEEVENPMNH
jgi:hypothetical protein